MAQQIKIVSVRSDGSLADEPIEIPIKDAGTGAIMRDADGVPCVVVTGSPIAYSEWTRRIERKYTKIERDGRGGAPREKVDWKQAMVDLAAERVTAWRGIVGADDQPLPVTKGVLAHFDMGLLAQIISGLTGSEVTADADGEFR